MRQGHRSDLVGRRLVFIEISMVCRHASHGYERTLGSSDFVEMVLRRAREDHEQRTRRMAKGPGFRYIDQTDS